MFHRTKKDSSEKTSAVAEKENAPSETLRSVENADVDAAGKEPEGHTGDESVAEQEVPTKEETPICEEDEKLAALADDLLKAQEELAKTKDAYVRAVADFDNYRRRINEERPKNMVFAKGNLAKDLFPVLDNFKLGLDAAEKAHPEAKSILEGFAMISSQIRSTLAQHGIVEIAPKAGEKFDPLEHESISSSPSEDVPEDHILSVQRVGYKIGDRLLRPASVILSSKK